MRLPELCSIHTGYTARGSLEPTAAGGVLAIQSRDFTSEGLIDLERLTRVYLNGVSDRYFVRAGDVVFRSRGERNTATALDERLSESALGVLPLMILRPNPEVVTPEFLAWAITNLPLPRTVQRQRGPERCPVHRRPQGVHAGQDPERDGGGAYRQGAGNLRHTGGDRKILPPRQPRRGCRERLQPQHPRYVDTFEPGEKNDVAALQKQINTIEAELAEVRGKMAGYLKELGVDV